MNKEGHLFYLLEDKNAIITPEEGQRYRLIIKDETQQGLLANEADLTSYIKGPKFFKSWQEIRREKRQNRKKETPDDDLL